MSASRFSTVISGFVALLLLGWTGWIAWNFRHIDGSGLVLPDSSALITFGGGALLALVAGALIGVICRNPLHPLRIGGGALGLAVLLFITWRKFGGSFLLQPDFIRIPALLLYGGAGGAGFGLSLWRSSCNRAVLGFLLVLPFLLLSLARDHGRTFLCLVTILAAAAGLGRMMQERLARDVDPDSPDTGVLTTVRLALGLLALSMLGLALGLMHVAYPAVLLAAVGLTIVLTRRAIAREATTLDRFLSAPAVTVGASWVAGISWALLLIAWICALAPEVGSDALGGRLAMVRLWANDHALASYREFTLSYMAIGGETLFLTLYPIAGLQSAKIGQLIAILALLPTLVGFVHHRTVAASTLLLCLGASSLLLVQYAWGFVDLVQTLFYVGAIAAGWLWWRTPDRGLLFVAGLLAAGAAAVKLNGLGAPLVLGLVVVAKRFNQPASRSSLVSDGLVIGVAGILVLGPWLLRTTVLTGNPIFPYANGVFSSPLAPVKLNVKHFGDPIGFAALVRLPWRTMMEPGRYAEIGAYHPLLLAVLPLALLGLGSSRARYWILTGLGAAVLWYVTEQNVRYTIFASLLVAGGFSLWLDEWLSGRSRLWQAVTAAMAGILFLAGAYAQLARSSAWLFRYGDGAALPLSVALGRLAPADYLATQLPYVPLLRMVDQTAGANAVVWEPPSLRDHLNLAGHAISLPHCDERLATQLRDMMDRTPSREKSREAHRIMLELGITHVLLPPAGAWVPIAPGRPYSAVYSPDFLEEAATIEGASCGYVLLKINPSLSTQSRVLGPNLFANPNFQVAAETGLLTGWTQNVALTQPVSTPLSIPSGTTLYQRVPVASGRLYRLAVEFSPDSPVTPGAIINMAWRDPAGRLLLFFTYTVKAPQIAGLAEYLQTAPTGASALEVVVCGPLSPVAIALQSVETVPEIPSTRP